ncbi:MAG: hypothetical protein K0S65_4006, partial [Labilithrix sp.]|nr:hypothetical protein [Labilithrix sp.]
MGAFYMDLRAQRVPHLLTLDALFTLVHDGIVRALAQVEEAELAPALQLFLERVDARLGAEAAGAPTELLDAYRLARGITSVARALSTSTYAPPSELARTIADERANIEKHAGTV